MNLNLFKFWKTVFLLLFFIPNIKTFTNSFFNFLYLENPEKTAKKPKVKLLNRTNMDKIHLKKKFSSHQQNCWKRSLTTLRKTQKRRMKHIIQISIVLWGKFNHWCKMSERDGIQHVSYNSPLHWNKIKRAFKMSSE